MATNVYLTGSYAGTITIGSTVLTNRMRANAYIAKINAAGSWQWATATRGGDYTPAPVLTGLVSDNQRALYLAGYYRGDSLRLGQAAFANTGAVNQTHSGAIRTNNRFVASLSAATGAWKWAVQTTGDGDEALSGPPLLDGAGHLLVSGSFNEPDFQYSPNMGNTFGPTTLHSAGGSDLVVAQLDTAGTWGWARQTGGPTREYGRLYYLNTLTGQSFLEGSFNGVITQLGAVTLTNPNASVSQFASFVAQTASLITLTSQPIHAAPTWSVYPNPARTTVTVMGLPPQHVQLVQLLDVLGRQILRATVPAQGGLQLSLPAGLAPGVYVVRAGAQARQVMVE